MKKYAKTLVPANPFALAARQASGAGYHQKGTGGQRKQQQRSLQKAVAEYQQAKTGGKPPVDFLVSSRMRWNHNAVFGVI